MVSFLHRIFFGIRAKATAVPPEVCSYIRPIRERFKECGRQGVVENVQAGYNPHRAPLCHTLADWKEGGAVGVAGVPCSSGRDSNYGAGFLGDVLKGGEARRCRFVSCEWAKVY